MTCNNIVNKNQNVSIEYYEVLTDRNFLWVHIDNLIKICKELREDQLSNFYFKEDNDVVSGKLYIMVTEPFLKFVAENTHNPKYKPELVLIMLKERESNFDGLEEKSR